LAPGAEEGRSNASPLLSVVGAAARRSDGRVRRPQSRPDETPRVQYARTADGVNLAYQVADDGPLDLIVVPGYISHLDT
jgi:hypothetical protein